MRYLQHIIRSPRLLLQILFTLVLACLIGGAGAIGLQAARNSLNGISTARMPGLVYLLDAEDEIAQLDYYSLSAALDQDARHRATVELPKISSLSQAAWINFRRYQTAAGHTDAFKAPEARITDLFNQGIALTHLSDQFNSQSMNAATSRGVLGASEAMVVAPLMQSLRDLASLDEAGVVREGSTAAASTETALFFLLGVVVLTVILVGTTQVVVGIRDHRRRVLSQPGADLVVLLDQQGRVRNASPSGRQLFGYSPRQLIGRDIHQFLRVEQALGEPASLALPSMADLLGRKELRLRHADGSDRWVEASATNLCHDPLIRSVLVAIRDVTARKDWETTVTFQATHDPLTSLPNRLLLQQRLQEALVGAEGRASPVALLVLDLDHFKAVNDTLGHHAGDQLLQQVSRRLQGTVRAGDTVGRLGGDEFAAILPAADRWTASSLAGRLVHALEAPFLVGDRSLVIGASIGIALSPDHGHDPEVLLKHADVAMYQARRLHLHSTIYEAESDPNSLQRLDLIRDLRKAIRAGELTLCYQPKVQLLTNRLLGVEALVRWQHPTHGLIAPDVCIPLAEEAGLLGALTDWALNTAAAQCKTWEAGGRTIPVAVNISPRSMQDQTFPERIAALLRRHALAPGCLTLEITEDSIISDPARARDVLIKLNEQGVRISIDDFGTGYSSLAYLKDLPVHELKVDKSFVIGMGDAGTSKNAAIVRSVIVMAHSLGLTVVAEGVEGPQTRAVLAKLKCDTIQGFHVSPAVPAAELQEWLEETEYSTPRRVERPISQRLTATRGRVLTVVAPQDRENAAL